MAVAPRRTRAAVNENDPYAEQLAHFARVIIGLEAPRVAGWDGLRSLAVVAAVIEASASGCAVDVNKLLDRS